MSADRQQLPRTASQRRRLRQQQRRALLRAEPPSAPPSSPLATGAAPWPAGPWPSPMLAGALLILVGALLQHPATLAGDQLAHLILMATGAMLMLRRLLLRPAPRGSEDRRWAGGLLGAGAGMALVVLVSHLLAAGLGAWPEAVAALAHALQRPALALSLALLALGLVGLRFGSAMIAALAGPILVVYVLVPLLPAATALLSEPLQHLNALLAVRLLSLAGGSLSLNGGVLIWGSLHLQIAQLGTGLVMLQHLLWVAWWALLLGRRGDRPAAGSDALLRIALVVPAVLIANALRGSLVLVLAHSQGPAVLEQPARSAIAWAAAGLAVLLYLILSQGLARLLPARAGTTVP